MASAPSAIVTRLSGTDGGSSIPASRRIASRMTSSAEEEDDLPDRAGVPADHRERRPLDRRCPRTSDMNEESISTRPATQAIRPPIDQTLPPGRGCVIGWRSGAGRGARRRLVELGIVEIKEVRCFHQVKYGQLGRQQQGLATGGHMAAWVETRERGRTGAGCRCRRQGGVPVHGLRLRGDGLLTPAALPDVRGRGCLGAARLRSRVQGRVRRRAHAAARRRALDPEQLRDLAPHRHGDDEDGEEQQAEERPEAKMRDSASRAGARRGPAASRGTCGTRGRRRADRAAAPRRALAGRWAG